MFTDARSVGSRVASFDMCHLASAHSTTEIDMELGRAYPL